ncbi:hypothetical protein CNR22_02065 [Sphingobacteriaceae bacterium]|nr:hypothetical protein CNR22_02065 [Sphingobacteriaceae bacterium]
MTRSTTLFKKITLFALSAINFIVFAQTPLQYFRPNNQKGLHTFETTKNDTTPFTGMKVRVGGNFTQDFQMLSHKNNATPVIVNGVNTNQLAGITNGFNLAMANLNIDAQLEDGIRMNLTMYLSSRHHEETWVKGGYIQFDKLPFFKSAKADSIMKNFTIKAGQYELDYGDQHFRRSDGGNAIYNPFIENLIMDDFATEIGGEIYFHPKSGFIAMVGITNGQLNPTVIKPTKIDSATGKLNKYPPAFHGKLGYDKQVTEDFRFRITGSIYAVKSAASNSLFNGDRTGSRYFYIMENTAATAADNPFSGRFNPRFSQQVTTFMINPFVKYKGLELFGTYEMAQGRVITEKKMRTATQYAVDLIYRFPRNSELFWIGVRYNSLTAKVALNTPDVTINRAVASLGWFVTKNIMVKAEYVNQEYQKFAITDIRSGGKFNGMMIEATIGF